MLSRKRSTSTATGRSVSRRRALARAQQTRHWFCYCVSQPVVRRRNRRHGLESSGLCPSVSVYVINHQGAARDRFADPRHVIDGSLNKQHTSLADDPEHVDVGRSTSATSAIRWRRALLAPLQLPTALTMRPAKRA